MKLIKSKNIQTTVEKTIAIVAIYSIIFTLVVPQTANAETQDVAMAMLAPNISQEPVNNEFPVSANRAPIKTINVVSTAYSSDVAQTDSTPCIPASGYDLCEHYAKYGEGDTIAANFLPLGTRVRFPELYGNKIFVVRDRMNSRYGYGRIDIWMPEYGQAKSFGVKRGLVMEIF